MSIFRLRHGREIHRSTRRGGLAGGRIEGMRQENIVVNQRSARGAGHPFLGWSDRGEMRRAAAQGKGESARTVRLSGRRSTSFCE